MNASPQLDAATQRIKQIHAGGGRPLTKVDEIDLIQRQCQMYLGVSRPFRSLKAAELLAAAGVPGMVEQAARKPRGRKPQHMLTHDDVWRQRWCGLYHRLIRLPALRKGKGYINRPRIQQLFLTYHKKGTPRHKLVAKVLEHLEQQYPRDPCPDASTLRRILKEVEPNFPN